MPSTQQSQFHMAVSKDISVQSIRSIPSQESEEDSQQQLTTSFMQKYSFVLFIVFGHTICAGGLTVVNKWALNHYSSAFTLTFVQLAFSAIVIQVCGWLRLVPLLGLRWDKVVSYIPAAAMFYITVVASNKVIQLSSVNTFIVVRCMVPVVVAVLEIFVLPDQATISLFSVIALVGMAVGGYLYVHAQNGVVNSGLEWIIMYFLTMPVDALLIKRALNNIGLSAWDLALYNNAIAACFMPLGAVLSMQWEVFHGHTYAQLFEKDTWLPVLVSCVAAVGISFFQMNARNLLTATAFMVLGVMNKLLTIILDKFLLHSTAPPQALIGVILAILSGIFWQASVQAGSVTLNFVKEEPPRRAHDIEEVGEPVEGREEVTKNLLEPNETDQNTSGSNKRNCLEAMFKHPYTIVATLFFLIGLENIIKYYINHNGHSERNAPGGKMHFHMEAMRPV